MKITKSDTPAADVTVLFPYENQKTQLTNIAKYDAPAAAHKGIIKSQTK